MKLSEAMRLGIAATAPYREHMCNEDGTATCALGAAYYGYYGASPIGQRGDDDAVIAAIQTKIPPFDINVVILPHAQKLIPQERLLSFFVGYLAQLNDHKTLGMSREQIATWLEQQGL